MPRWGSARWRATDDEASAGGLAAVETGAVSCVLAPELTEGPYYVDDAAMRRNIKGGKGGVPLTLRLRVLDVATCRPIRGAAVDIWHCDALGVYSGVAGNSGSFLRGVQRTDANGWATFDTVYPGLVPGPRRPRPRQGARRQATSSTRASSSSRRRSRTRSRGGCRTTATAGRTRRTRRTRSSATAAAARCCR